MVLPHSQHLIIILLVDESLKLLSNYIHQVCDFFVLPAEVLDGESENRNLFDVQIATPVEGLNRIYQCNLLLGSSYFREFFEAKFVTLDFFY